LSSPASAASVSASGIDYAAYAANGLLDPKTEEEILQNAVRKATAMGYNTKELLNIQWTI
jgi:hypothetical protein